jgi:lipopolysaccharide assembly protein A
MRIAGWIVGVPLAVLVAAFAVANRQPIRLDLWPLPLSVDLPAYLAVLGPLLAGVLVGAVGTWLSLAARRRGKPVSSGNGRP